jgi:uncharacterized protein (DUF885 family)
VDREFERLSEEILKWRWEVSPLEATFEGYHEYDDKFDRFDREWREELLAKAKDYVERLNRLADDSLSTDNRVDKTILTKAFEVEIKREAEFRDLERRPFLYPEVALYGIYMLILRDFAPLEERMRSVLGRLKEVGRLLAEGKENLRRGKDHPEIWTKTAMEMTQGGLQFFSSFVPLAAGRVPSLREEILSASTEAAEAFKDYAAFLEDELLPKSKGDFALGEKKFNFLLSEHHMLPYDAQEILEIGHQVREQTQSEMKRIAAQIDPKRTWNEIVDELKESHPTAEELLDFYRVEMERAKKFVLENDLASIPEGEILSVVETPPFERPTIPYAAYVQPAPFEQRQEGFFWVTPVDKNAPPERQKEQLQGHNKYGAVLVALHEAYPGHHLQLLHSNRAKSKVRRKFATSVFAEGWALYCEELMYEQGFYKSPEVRLLQLKDQLWRACRVVIDVMLHTGRMTFEEAVDMLVGVAKLEMTNAITEVKRYTQTPTQPMSYIIGKQEIMRLRDDYREMMGDKFRLKEFHDELLSYGTIPVSLVRQQMLS